MSTILKEEINEITQEKEPTKEEMRINELLTKNITRKELAELLVKEETKVKDLRKERSDLKKNLKNQEDEIEKAGEINKDNFAYLESLNSKLERTEMQLIAEGDKTKETIKTMSSYLDLQEIALGLVRKALQFDLSKKYNPEMKEGK